MSERIVSGYKRLFEVRLLHHYWLDDGSALFDTLPESRKTKLLLTYDSRSFLEVKPTSGTSNKLKALKGVFKQTSLGFLVAVSMSKIVSDDEVFSFVITIKDDAFYNYTALTLLNRNIVERYYAPQDKIYRYKENIPVFSNLTGVSRGVNPNKSLFLSAAIPASALTDKAEYFSRGAGSVNQQSAGCHKTADQRCGRKLPGFCASERCPFSSASFGADRNTGEGHFADK
jgi:hypothetical protein